MELLVSPEKLICALPLYKRINGGVSTTARRASERKSKKYFKGRAMP